MAENKYDLSTARILTLYPRDDNTQIGVYRLNKTIFLKRIRHSPEDLAPFKSLPDQTEFRKDQIMKASIIQASGRICPRTLRPLPKRPARPTTPSIVNKTCRRRLPSEIASLAPSAVVSTPSLRKRSWPRANIRIGIARRTNEEKLNSRGERLESIESWFIGVKPRSISAR